MTTALDTPAGHCARFRAATKAIHDQLDKRIMAFEPFSSREKYSAYLSMQYCFHRDVDALFDDLTLNRLLPGLAARRRFPSAQLDLHDLGCPEPALNHAPAFTDSQDLAGAVGWLYVEEGSNLGGAILFKFAQKLDLNEHFGARHLAPHPEGRAPSWRKFMEQLDAIDLDESQRQRAEEGAVAAFQQVLGYVEKYCPLP